MTEVATPTATATSGVESPEAMSRLGRVSLGLLRITLGWVMFWAGLDKLVGLGMGTPADRSMRSGASATAGYLGSLEGPAASIMSPLAGNPIIDALFVFGMLLSGLALLLGVTTRIAGTSAIIIFVLLWFTSLPLGHNPVVDEHLAYALLGLLAMATRSDRFLGLGRWWAGLPVVRDLVWLR